MRCTVSNKLQNLFWWKNNTGDHTALYGVGLFIPCFFRARRKQRVRDKTVSGKINNGYLLINLHQGNSFVVTFVSADLIGRC